jgi:prevent-host-death family protein
MVTVGIRELKQQTSELVRLVREDGQQIQITYRGQVVALMVPVDRPDRKANDSDWASLDVLAAEIGAHWSAGISSAEAVYEGRR